MHPLDKIMFFVITPISWSVASYLFWRWDLGGYRSDWEERKKKKIIT